MSGIARPFAPLFARCLFVLVAAVFVVGAVGVVSVVAAAGAAAAVAATAQEDSGRAGSDAETLRQEVARGPVRVELALHPAAPVIGDVIEFRLVVVSEPDVEVLMPEFGEALGRFEIVDFAPGDALDPEGRAIARQTYRLQPSRSGAQSIPPLRIEFVDRRAGQPAAPEGEDAYEILTDRMAFEVAPMLAADAPLELRPPHPPLGERREGLGRGALVALAAAALLALAGPFVWRALVAARAKQRQRSAYEVARGELDGLLEAGLPDAGTMDAFYVRLSLIVRTYLEDRFGLRSPELTTPEFLTEMGRSPDLARSHQQLLRDFLTQADLVKFAGLRPGQDAVAESVAAAERFLEETRDQVRSEALGAQRSGEVGRA